MQGPTLSNTKPKYRLLVSQSQSPFLIPATWPLSDLYPTSLYYRDHTATFSPPHSRFARNNPNARRCLFYRCLASFPWSRSHSSRFLDHFLCLSSVYHQSVGITLPYLAQHIVVGVLILSFHAFKANLDRNSTSFTFLTPPLS